MSTRQTDGTSLRAAHVAWPTPLSRPAMSNELDRHHRVALTTRFLEVAGRPAIPVSGELHFSRVPRSAWGERLALLRAMGVTVVSTYVIWIHHEPVRGAARFDGNLDVAAFVREAAAAGLDVVIRIGPWAHGEVRNGGFPDWVQSAPVRHRTDDPGYLALARHWYGLVGAELAPLCGPDSPIIGIQLENELVDQPAHLGTLKRIAREAGLSAPLWTATAWDGAELPADEVLPLYGGYSDGFWVDADAPWEPGFRAQFRFSHEWDDPGIGADLRPGIGRRPPRPPADGWPIATCELACGMATAYHRRAVPTAADLASLANVKLGGGSNWQGYYMAVGGMNPSDGLQESLATGYPNDLPRFDYDFHAPIGAAGLLAPSHAALRVQHAFLAAFGERLAGMPSSLPLERPTGDDDRSTLRWAMRSDGDAGFVFISQHQPHDPLDAVPDARFALGLEDGELVWPAEPVEVPAGTVARWPFNLRIGGGMLRWATASAVTILPGSAPGSAPTLVLLAEPGVRVEVQFDAGTVTEHSAGSRDAISVAGHTSTSVLSWCGAGGAFDVLIVPAADAARIWVLESHGERRLLRSDDPVWLDGDALLARSAGAPVVDRYDPAHRSFVGVAFDAAPGSADEPRPIPAVTAVDAHQLRSPGEPLTRYGGTFARTAAPDAAIIAARASVHRLRGLGSAEAGVQRVLEVEWAGDVAVLEVDGVTVADRFWDGTPWLVDLDAIGADDARDVVLRILPLHTDAPVHLPAEASARRAAAAAATPTALHAVDAVRVRRARLRRAT